MLTNLLWEDMGLVRDQRRMVFLLLLAWILEQVSATNFNACKTKAEGILNGSIPNTTDFDIFYHGNIRGLKSGLKRPLTLTFDGCKTICGTGVELNRVLDGFQILTTWVLPAVGLFSQLPYESLAGSKNVEAFFMWIGSPATALTSTMFNIWTIRKAQGLIRNRSEVENDAYYVLTSINQYDYPYEKEDKFKTQRDKALLYGILRPIAREAIGRRFIESPDITKTRALLSNLAFQLRLQRRKGVWPLAINIMWFLVAFAISITIAFTDLGDATTAHSLALGLLLSWLPILVVMAIVDRNPVGSGRCRVLIKRWLHNVDQILNDPNRLNEEFQGKLWRPGTPLNFQIGEFAGQGRRLGYCGVAHAVIHLKNKYGDVARDKPQDLAAEFQDIIFRPSGLWWAIWIWSWAIVSLSVFMAFMISFNEPTIGLGCRSLLYLIYYLFGLVSWFSQWLFPVFRKTSSCKARYVPLFFNACATLLLLLIMIFQVTGGLNNCECKSSIFGLKSYGGYMDFQNAQQYRSDYPVGTYWIVAAVFGGLSSFLWVVLACRRWSRGSSLWKYSEDDEPNQQGIELDTIWLT